MKKTEIVVNAIFENTTEVLVQKELFDMRGFGNFKIIFYNNYKARTSDIIKVGAKKMPFKE